MRYVAGLDLGKARDFTAIAIVEPARADLHLRHIERARLGTAYPAIVERVAALISRPELDGQTDLVVDATGVGVPVVDQMRETGLAPIPVIITAGKRIKCVNGMWRVPKAVLVRGLVAAIDSGRLKVAKGLPDGKALVRELLDFKREITRRGNAVFGGDREHDDLVIALALAVWWAVPSAHPKLAAICGAATGR